MSDVFISGIIEVCRRPLPASCVRSRHSGRCEPCRPC